MRHFITFKGINNGADLPLDVSAICNSIDTEIHDPRCTKEAKSAAGTATFAIGWTPDKVTDPYNGNLIDRPALYQTVIDAMLYSIENKTEMEVIIRDDSLQNICFRGYIDPSDVSLSRTKIPQKISVSCKDHTTDLDKKIGYNIVREGLSVNEIVEELLELCYGNGSHILVGTGEDEVVGTGSSGNSVVLGVKRVISDLPDSVIVDRFVVTADENTTYRQHIDKLLLEKAGGYVLHYVHATNKFEVVPCIPEEVDDSEIRFISFMSNEQVVTRTGVYSHDGILLKWPTIEERANDNVYSEDINLSYVPGYGAVGAIVQPGSYYPSKGDITATKQQFRRSDREYVTGASRKQNGAIDLLYAKEAQLGIVADPVVMTNKGTVQDLDALENLADPKLGWYALVSDVDGQGNSEYRGYNGSAWEYMETPSLSNGIGNAYTDKGSVPSKASLPLNPSVGDFYICDDTQITWCWMDGEWQRKISLFCFPVLATTDVNMEDGNPAFYPRSMWALGRNRSGGMVNLKAMSVTAKSVARTKVNKTTYPEVIKDPDEYDASYITDKTEAENFALFLYNFHRIACTTCTWYEWEGQRTPLSRLGERVRVEYMTGSEAVFCVIQLDYSAVTRKSRKIKVTALLVSGFASSFTGLHETEVAPQIVNRRQAVSQEINYANATNGTTIPETGWSTTRTIEKGMYLWTRYTTTYSDSTTETTYSVVYNPDDAEIFDFSFAVETFYRNKRLAQNQEITLTIDVQGLTGYVLSFNAYADGVLVNTLLDSTSNPSKLIIPMNNNYSKVQVVMSASPSSVHEPVVHEISVIDITDKDHDFGAWEPTGTTDLPVSYTVDGIVYNVIDGDFFVAKSTFTVGTDTYTEGIPYMYQNNSWHNSILATAENSGRLLRCLGSVLSDPNIQPSTSALYAWFENLVAKNAIIRTLNATDALFENIHVSGLSRFDGEIHSSALETTLYKSGGGPQNLSLDTTNQFWSYNSFADILNTVFSSDGYYSTTGSYTLWRKGTGNLLLHSITTDSVLPDSTTIYTSTRKQNLIVSVNGYAGGRLICDGVEYTLYYQDYSSVTIPVNNGSVIKTRGNFVIRDGGLYVHDNQADFSRKYTPFNSSGVPVALADYGSGSITVTYNSTTYTSPALYKWLGMSSASGGGYTSPGSTLSYTDEMGNIVSGHAISSVFWTSASEITFLDSNLDRYSIDTASYYRAFSASFSIAASIDSVVAATITPASSSATLGTPTDPWPAIHGDEVYGAVFN